MHIILETVYNSHSGTIANFNFDTSATAVSTSMAHLSSQYYDICIRRARNYCSICYSPVISGTTTASSFGLGANAVATIATANVGTYMSGVTTQGASLPAMVGEGDYLEILAMQVPPTTSTTITGEAVDYYNESHFKTFHCQDLLASLVRYLAWPPLKPPSAPSLPPSESGSTLMRTRPWALGRPLPPPTSLRRMTGHLLGAHTALWASI